MNVADCDVGEHDSTAPDLDSGSASFCGAPCLTSSAVCSAWSWRALPLLGCPRENPEELRGW
jgi:hypothetical protein